MTGTSRQQSFLAIFTPYVGAISETFIKRQIQLLNPGRTIVLTQEIQDASWIDFPVKIIPNSYGFSRYSPWLEQEVMNFLNGHNVTHILCEYGCYETDIVELNHRVLHFPIFVHFFGFDASQELNNPTIVEYYRWMGTSVTGIIVVARSMKARLINIGLPPEKIHVIPCGVDVPERVESIPEKSPCKFLSVTRLVPKKGTIYLLKAFSLALKIEPTISLDIVGDGPLRADVVKFIEDNQLGEKVKLHGYQPTPYVKTLINLSSVYVQHSVTDPMTGDAEGLPVIILEASAAGLPIISTFHEGIPDAVSHNFTGFLVNEFDVDAMAQYMIKLAQDGNLRRQVGIAAHEKIKREFSVEITIMALQKIMDLH